MSTSLETPQRPERPSLPPTPISYEEFLAWAMDRVRAEWVDGEIVLMPPQNVIHLRIMAFLYSLLDRFVRARQLGELFLAGLSLHLPTRPSGREPDLVFVATEHSGRLHHTYFEGPADLVVEIVSPDSVQRDRGEKLLEYEAAGIPEYWVIDPLSVEALFYQLGQDGRYRLAPIDADGFYRSEVLRGFRLRVSWLWQQPLPSVDEVARETEL
jgi:Uma2 family endonuclease